MPVTTPDEVKDRSDTPEVELSGSVITTPEAIEEIDDEISELWHVVRNIAGQQGSGEDFSQEFQQLHDRLDQLQDEVDNLSVACADCGNVIGMPWREPSECPDCGVRLHWDAMEEKMRG